MILPQSAKSFFKFSHMLLHPLTFHQHIIDIELHIIVDLVLEDFVDEVLISSSYILQAKVHDLVVV